MPAREKSTLLRRFITFVRTPKGAQAVVGIVFLLGFAVMGTVAIVRARQDVQPTAALPQETEADRFTDLFVASWRKSEGPALIEAILYHQALQGALDHYGQKTLAQRELNEYLRTIADAPVLPVLILVTTNDAQEIDGYSFTPKTTLETDAGESYQLVDTMRLDPLKYTTLGITRAYVLVFDLAGKQASFAADDADAQLVLTLHDFGGIPERQFVWQTALLTTE